MANETTTQEKFQLIQDVTTHDNNELSIELLCELAGVSRSGYYSWRKQEPARKTREERDRAEFEKVLAAYQFRGYAKGSRSIHMRLLHQGIRMNRKRISRLMRKFNLFCPIRKPNPYKKLAKAKAENSVKKNILNREFENHGARQVLLTDITYLFYGKGQKAYLSTIKDAYTKEILAYVVSASLEIDFVLETVNQLVEKHILALDTKTLVHSDQGVHYTSKKLQDLLTDIGLRQSMSRRGNCWDNAPQESFFGHMKDEIDINGCQTLDDLISVIDDYMDYYNNDRYQWHLAKLSPAQFYNYTLTGIYPLAVLDSDKSQSR